LPSREKINSLLGLSPLITHDQNGLALENLLEVGVDDSPANLATST